MDLLQIFMIFVLFEVCSCLQVSSSHHTLSASRAVLRKLKTLHPGKSFHLKRKTKEHHTITNNQWNKIDNSTIRENIRKETEKSYSLRSTSYAYVMQLDLGTPKQNLEFLIDTGSANMAIAGPECQDKDGVKCQIDTFYDPKKSTTSVYIGHPVEVEYGKGSWSGEVYRDVVAFPNEGPQIVADFAVIKQEKEFFLKNSVNEGILGLAYKTLSTSHVEPIFDQLVDEKKAEDVFTLSFCNGNGRFWLDYPLENEYISPIQWTRIIHRAWYTARMTGIDVAGHSLGLSPYSYPPAIIDSGTTDILLEPEIYIAVIAMLRKHGPRVDERFWNNYCVHTDPYKWPYITIYLKNMKGGSFALTILGKHYVRKQDQFHCLSIGAKQYGTVLGEVTLEGNVVIFDREKHRVGFAPSNLTDPDTGEPCGNPVAINTTVSGALKDFCEAPYMPYASCFTTCQTCIDHAGAWCPHGRVFVWINGVRSELDAGDGYCWTGNFFTFDSINFQTYLKGHGSVEFEFECFSMLPMYKQCLIHGEWLFAIFIVIVIVLTIMCACMCCRKVYEVDSRPSQERYPLINRPGDKEPLPVPSAPKYYRLSNSR
ncbi:beta-secretase-like [Clytia hemisphaerica]|uniref:Peptidase A1 domain-containing protein n=1 Tax=Clytia hemisphaerica TaxID=252671 RepID=A0A7M6DP18_9CNID|eukprot:TCONS_00020088-protein